MPELHPRARPVRTIFETSILDACVMRPYRRQRTSAAAVWQAPRPAGGIENARSRNRLPATAFNKATQSKVNLALFA